MRSRFAYLSPVALGCALAALVAVPARANLTITPVFTSDISVAAQQAISQALSFYSTAFAGNVNLTVGFASQGSIGGASSQATTYSVSYSSYLANLKANQSDSSTDMAALASLPSTLPIGGGTDISVAEPLAAQLGLVALASATAWAGDYCTGAVSACVALSASLLDSGSGTPAAGLGATTQHEVDEVLGTASALKGVTAPADAGSQVNTTLKPQTADLFRFGAAGMRSFATDPDTSPTCANAASTAYLSLDSGTTNLVGYNNCNNGGDYGDFAVNAPLKVQDWQGPDSVTTALTTSSPEVALLDAMGWNLLGSKVVGQPLTSANPTSVDSVQTSRYGDPEESFDPVADPSLYALDFQIDPTEVPEPGSLALLGVGLGMVGWRRVRRTAPTAD